MSDDYSADVQTTGAVAVGGSATGSIETGAHDQDWFAVELEAGRTYQFDLGGSPSGGGTLSDTFLRAIYDSEGRYQSGSYNDDFEGGRDSRVTFTASQSGTYYVRASGDRDETGSYTLRVSDVTPGSVEDPPPAEPPADTVAPAEADPARAAAEDLGDITELAAARFPLGTLDGGADGVALVPVHAERGARGGAWASAPGRRCGPGAGGRRPATCCTAARTAARRTSGCARRCWRGRIT